VKIQFSISFFLQQKWNGSGFGTFNGNLIWSKNGGARGLSAFLLSHERINFSDSHCGCGSWAWEWIISDYSDYIAGTYTFSIGVMASSSDLPAYIYLIKAAGSTCGYSLCTGFQSQGGSKSSLPKPILLWNLEISDAFYTDTYFVGRFGAEKSKSCFGPTFELETSASDEGACRFYTEGGYS
jgi:hypothetical protein